MTDHGVEDQDAVAAVGTGQCIVVVAGLIVPLVLNRPEQAVASSGVDQVTCYRLDLHAEYAYAVATGIGGVVQQVRTRRLVPLVFIRKHY